MPKLTLKPESRAELDALVQRYPQRRAALLPALRIIERDFGRIDDDGMRLCADLIGVSPATVMGIVTFYTHFKRAEDGKHVIEVCSTLPCALRGAQGVVRALEKKLGIHPGETSRDGRFTLRKVECLASCGTAPCMQVDGRYHENLTEEAIERILDALS